MKLASSPRRTRTSSEVEATNSNSDPSDSEKGQRKMKFSPPHVKSVKWRTIDQSFVTDLAVSKVGKDKVRSLSTDAVNNVAFGCYSVDELCYVLQDIGFEAKYPTKKKQLIKTIRSFLLSKSDLMHTADNEDVKPSSQGQGGLQSCEVVSTHVTGSSSDSDYACSRNPPTIASSSSVHHKSEVAAVMRRDIEDAEDSECTFVTECNSRLPDRLVSLNFFFSLFLLSYFLLRVDSNIFALNSNLFIIS